MLPRAVVADAAAVKKPVAAAAAGGKKKGASAPAETKDDQPKKDLYHVTFAETCFFPEGGGQVRTQTAAGCKFVIRRRASCVNV